MSGPRRGRLVSPVGHASLSQASLHVLRRFAFKCTLFAAWAGAEGVLGLGFVRPLALMTLISGLLCLALAVRHRERLSAPHWTYFDEAAWLLSIGSALRMAAT